MSRSIQIVEDDSNLATVLSRVLTKEGYTVAVDNTIADGMARLNRKEIPAMILADIYLPDGNGIEILKLAKSIDPDVTVVVMTGNATVESAIEAMKQGARDYLLKPFQVDELVLSINRLFHCRAQDLTNRYLKEGRKKQIYGSGILGTSGKIREILQVISNVADSRSSVLIQGESGTGKELIAQAIHFSGNRTENMFVPINCSAIPDELLESELFGHIKGAFTGATESKQGLFSFAEGGTLFLDEIGDLSLTLQAKLLRVLDDGRIRRVGDFKEIETDVRIVAATNKDVSELIKKGSFREDLFFRLAVIPIHVPPLRDRRQDIPLLAEHFMSKIYFKGKASEIRFAEEAMNLLIRYDWPGNVRELKNLLERLAILKPGKLIESEDLPREFHEPGLLESFDPEEEVSDYRTAKRKVLDGFHRGIVSAALKKHEGNVSKASESLGIDRGNFQRIMRRYGLQSSEYRNGG